MKRILLMFAGIFLIGMCVASYRMSGFGVDAFSCMNLGVSGFLHMSFGTWQLLINAVLLIIVWFTVRYCIGLGTIVNMVFVGYTADFLCWLFVEQIGLSATVPVRIVLLLMGTLFASLGCACYMIAQMGIAPYDSVTFIIVKYTREKLPFRFARMLSDFVTILLGVSFCMMAGNRVWEILGLGTVVNAFCNGPLIQFFRDRIEAILKK
ncbi:MAG: hypothetical protein HFI63_03055 [Lachnospiraceae bacterium]|nr:hypothetical protein [Lachnospiraceae bacterium]